jgi:hypothetical protein
VIDLHTHTTASDGRSRPESLARRAARAGIRVLAVTDHDTIAGVSRVAEAARPLGLRVVMGIEITAVHDGRDVHLLGYFFDAAFPELVAFLEAQRADRRRRIEEMLDRLRALGIVLNVGGIRREAAAPGGKAIGRPAIARALVARGHARDIADAFERYLAAGRPAFVPRRGATPAEVVALLARAGGLSSFAHPGKLGLDHLIPGLAAAGLTAVEVFHPDHGADGVEKYRSLAQQYGLAMTGGSDYHGPGSGRAESLGQVGLPSDAWDGLVARLPVERRG